MRDFRDSKVMAQTIRAALAAKGHKITISESLELIAKAFGAADWNTLAALIKAPVADGPSPGSEPALLTDPTPQRSGGVRFSAALERSLYRAVELAAVRNHGFNTVEHLLLALIDDADAADAMQACGANLAKLRESLTSYVDEELGQLVATDNRPPEPTAGFHRVVTRAVMYVQSSGRDVTGADLLVAIFSEHESHAAYFLRQQQLERVDAVNFIAHGTRKKGGRAA